MQNIYDLLEFGKIRAAIAGYARSEIGRKMALSLAMFDRAETLVAELNMLDEMSRLILRYGRLPIISSNDLSLKVDYALKGGTLTAEDLEAVANDILTASKVVKTIKKAEGSFPLINEKTRSLSSLEELEKSIHRVIAPDLSILSDASLTLRSLRRSIAEMERKMTLRMRVAIENLKEYLTEAVSTIRNGHIVLPIMTTYKSKVPGVIHDVSDTGVTTFIEPDWAVESNNELYVLKIAEKEEVQRLLRELSALVARHSGDITNNNHILGYLDFVASKADYGIYLDGKIASISEEHLIDIAQARHPLIDKDAIVANDFHFDDKTKIIVISGPNAGGKTVAIKTLGLMVVMNQCGLALPTRSEAHLSFFRDVFADIGDNQSLSSNLSTFSGHIQNLSDIAREVTSEDLVLLDEIGTGTSPAEGEAIAISYLEYVLAKKAFVLCSSHYDGLKDYALNTSGVTNASVLFDEANMKPTYVLKQGLPGRSYGLEMAERYHLDHEIVAAAHKRLHASGRDVSIGALDNLLELVAENEKIARGLGEEKLRSEKLSEELDRRAKALEEKRSRLLEDVEEAKAEIIKGANDEIERIIADIRKPDVKLHELIEAKHKIKEIDERDTPPLANGDVVEVGKYVAISNLGIVGKVERIASGRVRIISPDGLKYTSSIDKVHVVPEPTSATFEKRNMDPTILTSSIGLELNVIGLHVDEAMIEVAKYLDSARLKRFGQVRLIHGFGTGALKRAIHEYLKRCDFVEEYHLGGQYDGGGGATVVKLR